MLSKAKAKAAEAQAAAVSAGEKASKASKAAAAKAAEVTEQSLDGGGMQLSFPTPAEKEIDESLVPRNVVKEGFLQKAGGSDGSKPKKKRWFVVGDFALAYYDKKGGKLKGTVDLRGTTEVGPSEAEPFEINLVQSDGHLYRLFAASDPERENWLFAINSFAGYVTGRAAAMTELATAVASLSEQLNSLSESAAATADAAAATPDAVGAIFPASGDGVSDRTAAVETISSSAAEISAAVAQIMQAQTNVQEVTALLAKMK
jgi:hypothetical protein|eukprot:COSAG02_NODE_1457_length_12507_cov_7.416989_8_plen_260_part_00